MAGENRELGVVIAVGHRDACVARAADGRADARHDLEGDACGREFRSFLATASEDHRVAAFEAHHGFAGPGFLDDELVGFILGEHVVLGTFTRVDFFASGFGPIEEFLVGERVVNEDVREFDAFLGAQRDKTEVAGAGAYKITDS